MRTRGQLLTLRPYYERCHFTLFSLYLLYIEDGKLFKLLIRGLKYSDRKFRKFLLAA